MLNRHLLAASAVLRSAATKHAAPSAVLRSVRCNTAIKASQASPVSIRYFSQTYSVRNAAEATASTSEDSDDVPPTDSSLSQSTDPDAPNFVLPEGHTLRRTSKGELKVRPPKDSTFASLKGSMNYDIWKALTSEPFNYTNMSTVQENVLHLLPDLASSIGADAEPMPDGLGRDLLVKARTGTGKTIAFLVPALEARLKSFVDTRRGQFTKPWQSMLDRHKAGFDYAGLDKHGRDNLVRQFANNTVGVLILSPTRELATQISAEAKKLLTHEDSMRVQELVGGVNRSRQIDDWRRSRPDVVVATPGRLLDLLNDVGMIREAMSACRTLVFDEADTLLEMGFRDDIQAILKFLPAKEDRQNMMFSATVSKEIQEVARASLERNHRFIDCVPAGEDNVHKHIPQYATVLDTAAEQFPHILRLIAHDQLTNVGKSKVIVFAPTTKMTQLIAQILRDARKHLPTGRGSEVYEIHSKKDQSSRFNTSDRFRKDTSGASILVTSDVSARGVDYPGTTRVIQVGIPSSKDQYIHRIGRTGRAGASGRSDIVLMNWERGFVHFNLDDLPVKELSCDALTEEVQELCQRFDASPQEFQVRTQAPSVAAGRRQGKQSDRPRGQVGPHGPLSDKYLTSTQTPMLQDSLARLEPDEVKDVFSSLLGFYIARTNELRISKGAILEGLKKWAVESAGLDQPPHIGTTFLRKLGISGDSSGGRSSGGYGGGRPSFSRGGSDRGGSSYGGGRDFGGRESRGASRSFGGSRPPREGGFSRGGEGGYSRGGEGSYSRGGEGGFSRGGDRNSRGSSGPSKRW